MMVDTDLWKTAAAIASAAFAFISIGAALVVFVTNRRASKVDALIKAAEWFRSKDVEEARKAIYKLDRDAVGSWKTAAHSKDATSIEDDIAVWVGYLDVVSTLVLTRNVAVRDLVRMYGDVIFRTMYILAPYINQQSASRGDQYLKSTKVALPTMVLAWRKLATRGLYPREIVVSWETQKLTNCSSLLDDSHMKELTKVPKRRWRRS